jgi:hypothetical protein
VVELVILPCVVSRPVLIILRDNVDVPLPVVTPAPKACRSTAFPETPVRVPEKLPGEGPEAESQVNKPLVNVPVSNVVPAGIPKLGTAPVIVIVPPLPKFHV